MRIRILTDVDWANLVILTDGNDAKMHWKGMSSWIDDRTRRSMGGYVRVVCGFDYARHTKSTFPSYRTNDVGFRPAYTCLDPDDRFPGKKDGDIVVFGTLYMDGFPVRVPQDPTQGGDVQDYIPGAKLEMREPLENPAYQVCGILDRCSGMVYADRNLLKNISYEDIVAALASSALATNRASDTTRTVELAEKLRLKENERLIRFIPKWIEDSAKWAERMVKAGCDNPNIPGLRHQYVMNHLCPSLYHFHKMPDFQRMSLEEANRAMEEHMRENTQMAIFAGDEIIQRGVAHDQANWEALLEILQSIYAEHSQTH